MAVWMPVGDGFIEADVIRWKEPVYKNRQYGKPARLGYRQVTAEVLREADKDGWVYLLVRRSEVVAAHPGWNLSDVVLPPTDKETKRRLGTILRGNPERLAWSDESARAIVARQSLGNPNPAPAVSMDADESCSLRSTFNPVSARLNKNRPGEPGPKPPGLGYRKGKD